MPYVHISREAARLMEEFAHTTGQTTENAINEAIKEWHENFGAAILSYVPAIQKKKGLPRTTRNRSANIKPRKGKVTNIDSSGRFVRANRAAQALVHAARGSASC